MTIPQTCRCCGAPLHQLHYPAQGYTNPMGQTRHFPERNQVECHEKSCAMYMQTLDARLYPAMDLSEYLCASYSTEQGGR